MFRHKDVLFVTATGIKPPMPNYLCWGIELFFNGQTGISSFLYSFLARSSLVNLNFLYWPLIFVSRWPIHSSVHYSLFLCCLILFKTCHSSCCFFFFILRPRPWQYELVKRYITLILTVCHPCCKLSYKSQRKKTQLVQCWMWPMDAQNSNSYTMN